MLKNQGNLYGLSNYFTLGKFTEMFIMHRDFENALWKHIHVYIT